MNDHQNNFDDPGMERLLGGASGAFPDVNVAYGHVTRRVRQVKRRRAMVAGSAACIALFAGVAFAVRDGAQAPGLQPADTFTDGSTVTVDDSNPDDSNPDDSVTDNSSDDAGDSSLPDSAPDNSTSNSSGSNSTPNSASPGTNPTNSAGTTPSSPASSTPTTPASTPSTPATTAPPAPITQTFSGVGGSITVRLENGALTLVGSNAASGFTGEVKVNRGDRIEVIFDNGTHETKIRVDVVGNSMDPDISEN
ncbi:MAG TPA: hypothetical protein DCR14_10245 [Acidimicrobiaceae bacterium]|nr:hypothetical protein [Acidimicrobiaceae bacterium]